MPASTAPSSSSCPSTRPTTVLAGPPPPPRTGLDAVFGRFWPESRQTIRGNGRVVLTAASIALAAAVLLPDSAPGIGLWLILLATAALLGGIARPRNMGARSLGGLFVALTMTVLLTDSEPMVALCLLSAYAVAVTVLCRAETVLSILTAGVSVPLAWLRGLPWLGRSMSSARSRNLIPVLRTAVISIVLLVILTELFTAADAVFAGWVGWLIPDIDATAPQVFLMTLAWVLGSAYVGSNPPHVERVALAPGRALRRFEWVTPILVACAVFATFLIAQASALFGGHGYVERTTGLTYAQYVHQGFGQLVAATIVVVILVGLTLRHAGQESRTDRRLLRGLVGLIGALALVVVGSALNRIHVYEQAYGYTFLRLMSSAFEVWLGIVLVLSTTVGVWRRARWVPRAAVLVGIGMVLALALLRPDAIIAEHNVQRHAETGKIDLDYLAGLSADAVPALDRLPEPLRSCALAGQGRPAVGIADWNLSRARAEALLTARPSTGCAAR